MTTYLLIHGINNENNTKSTIEQTWRSSLLRGAKEAGIQMRNDTKFIAAFYGDILCSETQNWSQLNSTTVVPMSTDSPDQDFANDNVAGLYIELQRRCGITDEEVSRELDTFDDTRCVRMAKGIHKNWLKAIARCLETKLPSKGKAIARYFLPQAAAYLFKPGLKERIDDLVREQILKDPIEGDVVIVSHSLGTVVAYALLLRLRHEFRAKTFVTAGSPLGIEIVKHRLGPPLLLPPNVEKWVNVSDDEDFVALKPALDKTTFGCDGIDNYLVDNGEENPHDITKYLSHGTLAKQII